MNKIKEIAKYGKMLHESGLVVGCGGNISVRDNRGNIIIKKRGADMSRGRDSDYAAVPMTGVAKKDPALSTETPFHLACYAAKKDVGAVIHVHSPYIVAAGIKLAKLNKVSYEFECVLGDSAPVIGYIKPGSEALAKAIAREVKKGASAVLMRRHGAVSVGKTLEEAYVRMLVLERACRTLVYLGFKG